MIVFEWLKKDDYEFRPYDIGVGQQSFSFKKFYGI